MILYLWNRYFGFFYTSKYKIKVHAIPDSKQSLCQRWIMVVVNELLATWHWWRAVIDPTLVQNLSFNSGRTAVDPTLALQLHINGGFWVVGPQQENLNQVFSNESIILVASTLVGPALSQRDTWKRMVGITLAYAGLVEPDGQNDLGPTLFVNVGPTKLQTKCQRWSNKWLLSGINSSHSWKWIHEQ